MLTCWVVTYQTRHIDPMMDKSWTSIPDIDPPVDPWIVFDVTISQT